MINIPSIIDPEEYNELKDFLLEKWGEQADSFPGEFHVWLTNWIKEVIEEGEEGEFYEDIKLASSILVDEMMENCIVFK